MDEGMDSGNFHNDWWWFTTCKKCRNLEEYNKDDKGEK